ncbi:MAG: hypothetical protein IJ801_00925 [Lachnospiraceae bacterium]|nr:hypothetical protein [Lachnospiraceae bacterium]
MLVRDMFGLPDDESDKGVYNCYARVLESYQYALQATPDSLTVAHAAVESKYNKLECKKHEVQTDLVNSKEDSEDGSALFYEVFDLLNFRSDVQSCKNAASMLREYLIRNPGSVMGETLLKAIGEQFEE